MQKMTTTSNSTDDNKKSCSMINRDKTDNITFQQGHIPNVSFLENIYSEDDLRSRTFRNICCKISCLPASP